MQENGDKFLDSDDKWISVKDRLPDVGGQYSVWIEGKACLAYWFKGNWAIADHLKPLITRWELLIPLWR